MSPRTARQKVPEATPYSSLAEVYGAAGLTHFGEEMVDTVLDLVREHNGTVKRVLDLGCGVGAAAVRFAQQGYDVTGVDSAPDMLRRAETRARDAGVTLTLLEQDMRRLAVEAPVDLITCMFDTVNHLLEPHDVQQAFAKVINALTPGGLFIFDVATIRAMALHWGDAAVVEADTPHVFLVNQTKFDHESAMLSITLTGFARQANGYTRFSEVHQERGYPLQDLHGWLSEAGFYVLATYDYPEMTPAAARTTRAIFIARRPRHV